MTEQNATENQTPKPQPSKPNPLTNILLIVTIVAGAAYLTIHSPGAAWKVLLVALGFGAVVMIHELGHFLIAKMCGIKIEMFSIGFPPTILSFQKTAKGLRVRFMPQFGEADAEDSGTAYCIGLIPFGGFVKMMGQSDSGPVEQSRDPRSFANKPIWQRIAVVAGGVVFNAVGAMILFMALFSHGLDLMPPIVGEVVPNSPADVAGLKAGDRIVEIEGENFIDYTSIILAAALSDKDGAVTMKVEKSDGSVAEVKLTAEKQLEADSASGLRMFGIGMPTTLTVNRYIKDPNEIETLYEATKFRPGDVVTALNGKPLTKPWQLDDSVATALTPVATLTVARSYPADGAKTSAQIDVPMVCVPRYPNFRKEFDLANVYSMVPRLKVMAAAGPSAKMGPMDKIKRLFSGKGDAAAVRPDLEKDDIIIQVGDVTNPTYKDLRDQTIAHKDKTLSVTVLRKNKEGQPAPITLEMQPTASGGKGSRVTLGFFPALDMEHAVVAKTIDSPTGPGELMIPAGAVITKVDGQAVASFYDVIRLIRQSGGQRISIEYLDGTTAGGIGLDVPEQDAIHLRSEMQLMAPLEPYRETYKAKNPAQAIFWGVKKTWQFIEQSVLTFAGLFSRTVPVSSLSGPVGIASMSYKMAGQGIIDLLNFLGLLSSCLVVMNLLPLPIVDGGVILLLIIEKIRGVPLNTKIQEVITWIGLALLLSIFFLVTYNDILTWVLK
jgi:regulator of sigma E protease